MWIPSINAALCNDEAASTSDMVFTSLSSVHNTSNFLRIITQYIESMTIIFINTGAANRVIIRQNDVRGAEISELRHLYRLTWSAHVRLQPANTTNLLRKMKLIYITTASFFFYSYERHINFTNMWLTTEGQRVANGQRGIWWLAVL